MSGQCVHEFASNEEFAVCALANVVQIRRNAIVVIVMGVTGAGKTTIGRALATSLRWELHDGDDLHNEASKRKMHRGAALDDCDPAPWLSALRNLIQAMLSEGRNGVVASGR